jgi:potassium-dependent mechanosensitive channel
LKLFHYLFLALLAFPVGSTIAQSTGALLSPDSQANSKNAETAGSDKEKNPEVRVLIFPDLSEVGPRTLELTIKADDTRKLISASTQTLSQNLDIDKAEARLRKFQDLVTKISGSDDWDATHLSDANLVILKEKKVLDAQVAKLSATLSELGSIRSEWEKRQSYWREWREFLVANNSETPMETFDAARETIKKILEDLTGAINRIFTFQERVSRVLNENIKLLEILDTAFSEQRKNIFNKNEKSFLSTDFQAQFDASFWQSFRNNIGKFEDPFDNRSAWRMAARAFIVIFCVLLVFSLKRTAQVKEDRFFLLYHPWALGIFLAETLAVIVFGYPAGLARDLSTSLWTFSALILISGFLNIRPGRRVIFFLAALVTIPGILKMIPLPSPLFRIYWAGTALTGMLLFSLWAKQMRGRKLPGKGYFSGCLRVGAFVMAMVAAAQVAGFVSLSENLLITTMNIAVLIASVFLLLQINSMMIVLLLGHSLIADMAFIRRFGKELGVRITAIMKVAIWGTAIVFLMPIVGVYSSVGKAFEKLFLSSVTIGSTSLSLLLVLMAALVLYLSSFISWIIRAILETEVFHRMQVDRGAGQSITKLLHYFLIFIGFLISMGLIGIDLKSFAVLGGALGIGIGFGLQNIVNNFLSGLILLFERPVRVGDRIEADSQLGIVKKIGLRSTVIETLDQAQLIVPNSQLISEKVTNWTHSGTVARLKIPVGVAYGSDMDLVFDVLTAAAQANPHVLPEPKPLALLRGFGESCLNIELHAWLSNVNEIRRAQSEISREILRRFGEAGIDIPFPQQDVRLQYKAEVNPDGLMPQTK